MNVFTLAGIGLTFWSRVEMVVSRLLSRIHISGIASDLEISMEMKENTGYQS